MNNSASKQRLRMAHQLLDKQLSNSGFGRSNYGTKQTEISRSKNVHSEISQLEKKLNDLQRKMENIDVSSSNDQEQNIIVTAKGHRNSKVGFEKFQEPKQKQRVLSKNSKYSNRKMKSEESSAQQDSVDENQIYAKMQLHKQNKIVQSVKPKFEVKKQQPLSRQTNENKTISSKETTYQIKKPQKIQNIVSQPNRNNKSLQKNNSALRNSIKSSKSRKSINSNASKKSGAKIQRSNSKNSVGSIQRGGLAKDDFRQLQKQNQKDLRKINNLQKQLNHYKRLCLKQQQKLQQYRIMQIQYRKLEANFTKSEQIRKQQKKIIQSLKTKN